ncbi:toxic anion resistance protein [Erysipelotrichaceae bacterium OH741_COT-311]|nr:toxic anion resistance protein [Erysipelotrichaceae bacterium OH741_COT-311]
MENENKIVLTLENNNEAEEVQEQEVKLEEVKPVPLTEENMVKFDDSALTDEERKMVADFAEKIDITSSDTILQYGASAQAKIAKFSETALGKVRTKDLDEVGDMMTNLIGELKGFKVDEEEKGIFGFFKKQGIKLSNLKTKYDKAEVNVNKISKILEDHQIVLLKDIALLDGLYDKNLVNFKELTMYILAGNKRLEEIKANDLPKLREKAQASGLPEDAQAANDLANAIDRFEKKLHDLELTRVISIQMAPQIRLVQNNDTLIAEKIQSTLVNTIPLWKSQMLIALGLTHSKQAMQAQREVTNMTNSLLKKNAEMLKTATIETAKESERGIVDIETLTNTNQKLIETLDEVARIQSEGRTRRANAQVELRRIEKEINEKLLSVRQGVN